MAATKFMAKECELFLVEDVNNPGEPYLFYSWEDIENFPITEFGNAKVQIVKWKPTYKIKLPDNEPQLIKL